MTTAPETYACELRERPARNVMTVHFRSPVSELSSKVGEVYGAVFGYVARMGAAPAGPPFVAYYNMDMADLELEAGCEVNTALPGSGDVQPGIIPAGREATCLHVGPYDECGDAYEALAAWMRARGYEATGVAYEYYLNDPQTTPPEALQTEIVMPIK